MFQLLLLLCRMVLGKKDMSDQLAHIRQANRSMREVTEAMLWLGRDNHSTPQTEDIDLFEMASAIAKDLGYLLEGQKGNVER